LPQLGSSDWLSTQILAKHLQKKSVIPSRHFVFT
jgi:hypothetical protein